MKKKNKKKIFYQKKHIYLRKILFFQFKCCGIDGPSNWKNHFGDQLPSSCCQKPVATCRVDDESVYKHGCKQSFLDSLLNNLYILAHVGFGAGLIQVSEFRSFYFLTLKNIYFAFYFHFKTVQFTKRINKFIY